MSYKNGGYCALALFCAGIISAEDTKEIIKSIDQTIVSILSDAVKPDGLIDQQRLANFNAFFESEDRIARLGADAGAVIDRIARVKEWAPRASQILRNGYDLDRYKKDLAQIEQQKSRYAQSLINAMIRDWRAALSVLEGYPVGTIQNPSPYDVPYDAIVSQYLMFANKLEQLGENPPIEAVKELNQEFLTQFDRMLTTNDIGRARKKVLIEWLGGETNYLGSIMGSMIIARSPGFPRSGFVPMS